MDSQPLPIEQKTDPLLKPRKSIIRRVFAVLRLAVFFTIIAGAIVNMIPQENLPDITDIGFLLHPFNLIALLVGILILGSVLYLMLAPSLNAGGSALGGSFDFESMIGIVMGMVGLVLVGIITLFTAAPSNSVIFTLILTGMYTFYIYRVIKDTWVIQKENLEIRKRYGELVEVDKEKSDFIMITSHQLRTPLTEMRWSLDEIIRHGNLEEKFQMLLKKTLESVSRLANIVDDMLKTRAFEVKNHILKKTAVDAAGLIADILNDRELFAKQKNVSLNFAKPDKKIMLDADKDKIRIAIENMIDNAIRYSPNGKVNISLGVESKMAKIVVEDSGIGIDLGDQKRIFTKFFRTKNAMLVQPDGSGIGLYATKNIIEQHGGSVNFFSELNKGTKFIVTLPLAK